MAAEIPCSTPFFLYFTILLSSFLLPASTLAQLAPAPTPAISVPANITGILEKAGQYNFLIGVLNQTHATDEINNLATNSHDGVTLLAPTDNAFGNLPTGALDNLTEQQTVELVFYHTVPKYYSLEDFRTVSNPVRTLAAGQDGVLWVLNFITKGNQVNVSTGIVDVPINNQLSSDPRLAVYRVDSVLLPSEIFQTKRVAAPSPSPAPSNSQGSSTGAAAGGEAPQGSSTGASGNGSGKTGVGLGLMSAVWLLSIGLLS